ncbi:MAG: amidohydrolase family protein [Candidatus Humimicrobiaceae bacterium]
MDLEKEIKSYNIIDSHMHLGILPNVLYYNYSDERVVQLQKKFNVKISICSHCISFYDLSLQITEILKVQEKFGPFFYWNLVYDPKKASESLKIIENNRHKINFAGIKIHPVVHETKIDSKLYEPLWEYASGENIVVSSHTWSPYTDNPKQYNGNPLLFESVLQKFSKLKIILGHSGGKTNFYPEVINFVSKHENVYMDFSGDNIYPPVFKMVLERAGKGKILFGTDMPMMDIRYHIASVLSSDIKNSDKEDIFYNTAAKLYNFC